LVPHDEEIHAATLRVRRWFKQEIKRGLAKVKQPPKREQPE
jgi:hypothetical protein